MDTYCENCGAKLKEESKFCHKCGNEVKPDITKTCPKCGERMAEGENFCENCGFELNAPVENESFIERHKLIIMIALFAFIIVALIPVSDFIINETAGTQAVTVERYVFQIPDNFNKTTENKIIKSDSPGTSQRWSNGDEYIEIWILPPKYNGNSADSIISSIGGGMQSRYGYTGYHNKFSDGGEAFSYTKENRLITIFVSNERLFDKIEVS
ncbi:zinc-ribbon domain-containing protein [Methanobrevibacter sp.]|uniref:zinc ribbon domain-containing protein n=1 Tax=Methanobrevibacter sp. TaxID=66852 RepID=UPI003867687A